MATNADDLPPPPPPRSAAGADDDLPPPPPHRVAATAQPKDTWDEAKHGPKPGFWDPEMYAAGTAYGLAEGAITKGVPGLVSAAYDMTMGLGTLIGHVTSSDSEPDPEYDRLKNEWFGTKPIFTGVRALRQSLNQWYSLPESQRRQILQQRLEEYNKEQSGKSAFERAREKASMVGDVATGIFGPNALVEGVGAARKSMQFGTDLEKVNRSLITGGTLAMRETQLSQAERYAKTKKEGQSLRSQAEQVRLQAETTAHERVKALHGVEFPPAEHSLTPTNEQLAVKTKDLIVDAARDAERIREDAGKLTNEWENALDLKQQNDPQGFWKSPVGRMFSRGQKTRLGLIKPRGGFKPPGFMPTPQERGIVTGSFERIRGGIPKGARRVVPVSADDLVAEVHRISGRIGSLIKNSPGDPEIGYLERYQEAFVKALGEYVGKPYPADAYAASMVDKRTLFHDLGLKEVRVNPGEPKKFTTSFNSTNIFKDPEKFKALRLHIGDEAADNLALQFLSNNLAGKTSQQAIDFLKSQRWFSEASPNAFEMAHSYVDALAIEEKNYKVLEASAQMKDAEAAAVKAKIKKIGTDRTSALNLLKKHLASKTGPQLVDEWSDVRESLLKSGALTPDELKQLDDNIQKISKMQTTSARNKAIANTVARMGGWGAATYEFNRFMNFMGK